MSYAASEWALYFAQCPSASSRYVLMILADAHNGTDDKCFPSIETICELSGIPRSTVFACLKQLEDAGLIGRSKIHHENGRQKGVEYELHMQFTTMRHEAPEGRKRKHLKSGGAIAGPQGGGSRSQTPEGPGARPQGVQEPDPSKGNRERESKEKNTEAGKPAKANVKPIYSDDFLILWDMVPKDDNPGSKSDAAKAFNRLTKADQDACIDGWMAYLDWLEAKRTKRADYPIKQCVSFINGKLWETYLEAQEANHG